MDAKITQVGTEKISTNHGRPVVGWIVSGTLGVLSSTP
jgi:hypothetical protein